MEEKKLVETPVKEKEPEFIIDPQTGYRNYKDGRITSYGVTAIKLAAGSVKATEYIGIGPLVVLTPGGDVKANSGDLILTFEEQVVELKGADYVPVIDPITEKQKVRITKLVLARAQLASMGWKPEYEEIEISPRPGQLPAPDRGGINKPGHLPAPVDPPKAGHLPAPTPEPKILTK